MKKLLFLLASPVMAAEPLSLFLNESEQAQFNQDVSYGVLGTSSKSLTLKAILMSDEANWTVWLNDLRITPETCPDYVEVLSVTPNEVEFIWKNDCEPQTINLRTNESVPLDE